MLARFGCRADDLEVRVVRGADDQPVYGRIGARGLQRVVDDQLAAGHEPGKSPLRARDAQRVGIEDAVDCGPALHQGHQDVLLAVDAGPDHIEAVTVFAGREEVTIPLRNVAEQGAHGIDRVPEFLAVFHDGLQPIIRILSDPRSCRSASALHRCTGVRRRPCTPRSRRSRCRPRRRPTRRSGGRCGPPRR